MPDKSIEQLILQGEGQDIEFKLALPTPDVIARVIAGFANAGGGTLILGVKDDTTIQGISEDTPASSIMESAIARLRPRPRVEHYPIELQGKRLYIAEVKSSDKFPVVAEDGIIYIRNGEYVIRANAQPLRSNPSNQSYVRPRLLISHIKSIEINSTESKFRFLQEYISIIKILELSQNIMYPASPTIPTILQEGVLQMRMLFSSMVDAFERYFSDLLLEIYLAKPETLKSSSQISVEDILRYQNMSELIHFIASKRIEKLSRGSVKGFVKENKQIECLGIFNEDIISQIDRYFQIRHLYIHSGGRIDAKFIKEMGRNFRLGDQYRLSVDAMCDILEEFCRLVSAVDQAAIDKYSLSCVRDQPPA